MLVLVLPLVLLANPLSCVQAPGAARGALGALLLGSVLFGIDLDAGRGIGAWKSRESSGVTVGRTRPRRLLGGKIKAGGGQQPAAGAGSAPCGSRCD